MHFSAAFVCINLILESSSPEDLQRLYAEFARTLMTYCMLVLLQILLYVGHEVFFALGSVNLDTSKCKDDHIRQQSVVFSLCEFSGRPHVACAETACVSIHSFASNTAKKEGKRGTVRSHCRVFMDRFCQSRV